MGSGGSKKTSQGSGIVTKEDKEQSTSSSRETDDTNTKLPTITNANTLVSNKAPSQTLQATSLPPLDEPNIQQSDSASQRKEDKLGKSKQEASNNIETEKSIEIPEDKKELPKKLDTTNSKQKTDEKPDNTESTNSPKKILTKIENSTKIEGSVNTEEYKVEESAKKMKSSEDDKVIPLDSEDQRKFDDALSTACLLVKSESLSKRVNKHVTRLELRRALPTHFSLYNILSNLSSLQDIDISNNNIGPEGFRSICLAMCANINILSLNLADNKADTDSAECLGKMLTDNKTLIYLDVSNNYLGKDYFSRCVGPALKVNSTLQTLRAENIGSADIKILLEGLLENKSLTELDFSKNCVSDNAALGKGLAQILKKADCSLKSLALSYCEMNWSGIEALAEALVENKSLSELNLTGNKFGNLTNLFKLVVSATCNSALRNLNVDSANMSDFNLKAEEVKITSDSKSSLEILSLRDSYITDVFMSALTDKLQGRRLPLVDIDLAANGDLTQQCIESIVKITSDQDLESPVLKLNLSVNSNIAGLPDLNLQESFPYLKYLNVRRSKIPEVFKLSKLFSTTNSCLTTLILDGLKIANTDVLAKLFENVSPCSLQSFSVSSCSLTPQDITPLCNALRKGLPLQMLKLSANRLEDKGITDLVEALVANKTHSLAVLDVSTNLVGNAGATSLASVLSHKKHKTKLHSLNVSGNNIGKEGLLSLVSVIGGKFPLRTLHLQGQLEGLHEPEIIEVFTKLAKSLGFTLKEEGGVIKQGCSDLPVIPDGFLVKMSNLGGNTGDIGRMMDSMRIHTDFVQDQLPFLTFSDIQIICAHLKGIGSDTCVWSMSDWKMITGASRSTTETPSWLELESSRDLAVYIGNLPGHTTQQKMDGMLEMEADCNIDEVCLMKDPITRANNGVGWVLMCDKDSVQKAVEFFQKGEAKVFGQAFSVSEIKVQVNDEADAQTVAKARDDLEERMKRKKKEEQEHRSLILRKTEESWKRHAYMLAHPAYADGRVW